jgi:hypothetical protein
MTLTSFLHSDHHNPILRQSTPWLHLIFPSSPRLTSSTSRARLSSLRVGAVASASRWPPPSSLREPKVRRRRIRALKSSTDPFLYLVYIAARKLPQLQEAATRLSALGSSSGGSCTYLVADLKDKAGCEALAAQMKERESKLHVLVNNSGATWVRLSKRGRAARFLS